MPNRSKNILIASGGTGGHVFPAQALAKQLQKKEYNVLFMGKGLDRNKYFRRDLFASHSIDSATPFRKGIFKKILSIVSLARGIWQAFLEIKEFQPTVVIGFGSFHSFPVLVAAFLRKIPIVLFESNSVPGKVNRLFSRYSLFCGIQFPQAKERLKGTCHEVVMPFWAEEDFQEIVKKEALDYFSLEADVFTVLVFGGSQGAAFINPIVAQSLRLLHQENKPIQVIHMTGCEISSETIKIIYQESKMQASVKAFEKNMQLAWASADLVICRAGAATIAEMIEFEVPSILIPYPISADQHQLKNALFLSDKIKGSYCLEEKNLTSEKLLFLLKECNPERMKTAIQLFKIQKQKKELIDHIEEVLKENDR